MNIEDLVYKTGPDGKPKKPKKAGQAAIGIRTSGKAASDFAAAVKAELDAKEAVVNKVVGLKGSDRLAARLNDAKGQPKVSCTWRMLSSTACDWTIFRITRRNKNIFFHAICYSPSPVLLFHTEHSCRYFIC